MFSRYHFLLHRCSRFEFFPSLSAFFVANTRKHRATVKPENRYMKPESTETHFAYLFHFVGFYFSSSFHPHWLGSSTISSKSLAFIFLLRCMKLIAFSLSSIFYSKVEEEKQQKYPNTLDFYIRNVFSLRFPQNFVGIFYNLS